VDTALDGTGALEGAEDIARKELAMKGVQYQVVWMYVLHEFEDALIDCKDSALKSNDNAVHAWDEGVAFYTGSLEGPDGTGKGQLLHALADKRCANFNTCGPDGLSAVNSQLKGLFQQGEEAMSQGKCEEGAKLLAQIKPLMTIPLIQGTLRYAYKTSDGKGGAKEIAEGWAFAAAVLPQVDAASPDAAAVIRKNMEYGAASAMSDGHEAVFKALESVYAALGVACEDIGQLTEMAEKRTCTMASPQAKDPAAPITTASEEAQSLALQNMGSELTVLWVVVIVNLLLTVGVLGVYWKNKKGLAGYSQAGAGLTSDLEKGSSI